MVSPTSRGIADVSKRRRTILSSSLATVGTPAARARLSSALAAVRLAQGRTAEAIKIAGAIPLDGLDAPGLAAAGEVFAAAGRTREATAVADTLLKRVGPDARAFGSVIRAQVAIAGGDAGEARRLLAETRKEADAWLVRYWLGRAYLAMNMFAEADGEFETCLRRRGEATAVFLDDFPTYHRLLEVHYYPGLAREGMKVATASESFKTFLAPKKAATRPEASSPMRESASPDAKAQRTWLALREFRGVARRVGGRGGEEPIQRNARKYVVE